jgi:glyoxylase-like metal-dependent hydrolase (beta-lactamase superfamily II)
MLEIRSFPGAPLETNCYLVADVGAGAAILIDAPWQVVDDITDECATLQVTVQTIVCTHGHWDHTMGLAELVSATGARVACHAADVDMLEHPSFAPFVFPFELTPVTPDMLLQEGDQVQVGGHTFSVLHTPGHTPGCICLYDAEEKLLFSGDTLFCGTCGRMDLPGGDPGAMVRSLHRLATLPADTHVFPGHGPETTIGREEWLAHAEAMCEE